MTIWCTLHSKYYEPYEGCSECADVSKEQVGGDHYLNMAIQPIQFIHANNLGFFEGNIIKYLCRHRQKGGAEDIKKAIHYCKLILELEYPDA